jgi:6,7-dimethyl-8-ribityllumazine synthase
VVRGETSHYDVVVNQSAAGLTEIAIRYNLAIGNGILTVENTFQALHRANPAYGNKGGEAANAALALWRLRQQATS